MLTMHFDSKDLLLAPVILSILNSSSMFNVNK
jgi:hypothetical protein